jgi:hypothetical protein
MGTPNGFKTRLNKADEPIIEKLMSKYPHWDKRQARKATALKKFYRLQMMLHYGKITLEEAELLRDGKKAFNWDEANKMAMMLSPLENK